MAKVRRVVTGVDAVGKSIVLSDGYLPDRVDGIRAVPIHASTGGAKVPLERLDDSAPWGNRLDPHATSWMLVEFPPDRNSDAPRRLHTTDSIDYVVIRSGEITILLDDEDVLLKAGDYLVIGGIAHGWANRSAMPCLAEFCVIGLPREVA